MFNLYAQSTNK